MENMEVMTTRTTRDRQQEKAGSGKQQKRGPGNNNMQVQSTGTVP
jgi:hypothetical protein